MKKIHILALVLVLAMSMAGCSAAAQYEAQKEFEKYDSYIEQSNFVANFFSVVVSSYLDGFSDEEGNYLQPEGPDDMGMAPFVEGFLESMKEVQVLADEEPDFGEADEAMKTLSVSALETMEVINELSEYYESASYEADDFAKARELHPVVYEKFLKTYDDYVAFMDAFEPIINEREEEQSKRLKDEGYYIHYYAAEVITQAQKIQALFEEKGIDDSNLLDMPIEELTPYHEAIVDAFANYKKYCEDEKQLEKEGLLEHYGVTRYMDDTERFMSAEASLYEAIRTGTPSETGEGVIIQRNENGTIGPGICLFVDNFDRNLNTAISAYNIHFLSK